MALPTTELLTEAERLLQNNKFPEALASLERIDRDSLSSEVYGYYYLLLTEARLYLGNYSSDCIDEAIEIFRYTNDTEKFAKAKFLKGWCLSALGRHFDAKELLIEAYSNYLRCEKLREAANVLNRLSFVSVHSGNIESAIGSLTNAVNIYQKLGDRVSEAKAAHNLAYLYFASGKLRDSLSVYNSYSVTAQEHGEKTVLNFYSMSPIPHALKGDIATAKKTIEKCQPYLDKYIRDKAIYFENLGLISILDHDYNAAEKALTSGLKISLEIAPESALVSQIKRLFGDLYVSMSKAGMDSRFHGNDKDASFLRKGLLKKWLFRHHERSVVISVHCGSTC